MFASTGDLPPPAPLLELATASYQSLKLRWTSRNTGSKTGVAGVTYTLQMLDKNGRSDCNAAAWLAWFTFDVLLFQGLCFEKCPH